MGFKLVIELEAQIEIEEAIEWYESKQVGLGADFLNYLNGYFQTLKNGKAFWYRLRSRGFGASHSFPNQS